MRESINGRVGIKNLTVSGFFGVYAAELEKKQNVFIDVSVVGDIEKSIAEDDINIAIDYESIKNVCQKLAGQKKYNLIETYAKEILDELFLLFDISEASVLVKKPKALSEADFTFVELSKKK